MSNQILILKFLVSDPEPQRMSTYHSDGSSVWRSHAISRYLCLSFLLTTFVTTLVVVWKTQDFAPKPTPKTNKTKSFSTEKKIPNSRSASSAHLALKKKKENQSPDRLCSKSGHQKRILCASWIIQYILDILWGRWIKLIQVASDSELRKNQWNDLLLFEIVPSHCFAASEAQPWNRS